MSSKNLNKKDLEKYEEYRQHLSVRYIYNEKVGLKGFIAIHNNNLGPAVGGTRLFPYKNEREALIDALRLSRAMTYKCAIAKVPFGGGKAVIICDPNSKRKPGILSAYALEIKKLNGIFYTGEDVGISEGDVQNMLKLSPFFIGKSNKAGDPSPFAAIGTYRCMKLIAEKVFGKSDLKGKKIAIKGVGKVGGALVEMLLKEKAKIYVADINNERLEQIKSKSKDIRIADSQNIHKLNVDIYSPCALGGEFNSKTMKEVNAKIICGAANNQLESEDIGDWFFSKGIVYGPDYIVNAGGLIDVVDELSPGGYKKKRVLHKMENVFSTLDSILTFSREEKIPINRVTNFSAESVFNNTDINKTTQYLF